MDNNVLRIEKVEEAHREVTRLEEIEPDEFDDVFFEESEPPATCGLQNSTLVLSTLVAVLLLASAVMCLAFSVVIAELKADVSSLKKTHTEDFAKLALEVNKSLSSSLRVSKSEKNLGTFSRRHYKGLERQHNVLTQQYHTLARNAILTASCASLPPSSPSGRYSLWNDGSGSPMEVYCDTTRSCGGVTGGWTRVVRLDARNESQQCPQNLTERTSNSGMRTCGAGFAEAGCGVVAFPVAAVALSRGGGGGYSKVCGRIIGYQTGSTDAFARARTASSPPPPLPPPPPPPLPPPLPSSDAAVGYVDGVTLTYGDDPIRHIWTFAAGLDEIGTTSPESGSPYENKIATDPDRMPLPTSAKPPPFVGNDYFCETRNRGGVGGDGGAGGSDELWDGARCGPEDHCCAFNDPPWFYKELPERTEEDIVMRVCRDEPSTSEDVTIEIVELYVQ